MFSTPSHVDRKQWRLKWFGREFSSLSSLTFRPWYSKFPSIQRNDSSLISDSKFLWIQRCSRLGFEACWTKNLGSMSHAEPNTSIYSGDMFSTTQTLPRRWERFSETALRVWADVLIACVWAELLSAVTRYVFVLLSPGLDKASMIEVASRSDLEASSRTRDK